MRFQRKRSGRPRVQSDGGQVAGLRSFLLLVVVTGAVLACQKMVTWAWLWLPVSAATEMTAFNLFAINLQHLCAPAGAATG